MLLLVAAVDLVSARGNTWKIVSARVSCARVYAMNILVRNAFTGCEIASLTSEHTPLTVRDVQRLVKRSTGVPKKAQHVVCGAVRLAPRDIIPASSAVLGVLVTVPVCAHCGAAPERLHACSSCLDAVYCDVICQRNHWCHHRDVCRFRPEPTTAATTRS
jgi:hypothetical protein